MGWATSGVTWVKVGWPIQAPIVTTHHEIFLPGVQVQGYKYLALGFGPEGMLARVGVVNEIGTGEQTADLLFTVINEITDTATEKAAYSEDANQGLVRGGLDLRRRSCGNQVIVGRHGGTGIQQQAGQYDKR